MASPADQLSQIIGDALTKFVQDNPHLFNVNVNENVSGGSAPSGGGSGDIVAIVLGLVSLGILAEPEIDAIIAALKGVESAGGSDGLSFTVGYFLASTLLSFAEPYTRYVTHAIEDEAQSQIFDVTTAADLASKGFITNTFGQSEAGGGGWDESHWNSYLNASYNWPALGQIFQMWNRGYIGDTDAASLMQRVGVPPSITGQVAQLKQELLTPADWALALLRQNVTEDQAAAGAAQWGLSSDDFQTLLLNTGEPPGTMQLLEAYRRGFIDQPTLVKGILQSRVRDEWVDTLEKLRYAPMSTAAAANAVVRGYLSQADGQAIAEQNGLEPDHWQYVYESNGRPPSHEQLSQLYYRGIINRSVFDQGVRESDIKDKYIDDEFDLGVKLLPLFEAVSLLKGGDITGATFSTELLDQGYQKATIDEIVKAVGSGTAVTQKHLTVADITEMYTAGSYDATEAANALHAIGLNTKDADSILTVADLKQHAKLISRQVSQVESQYNRRQLDDKQAEDELTQLGVSSEQATKLVQLWTVTRPASTRNLSESQILHLYRKGKLDKPGATARLVADGLSETDAELLLSGQ